MTDDTTATPASGAQDTIQKPAEGDNLMAAIRDLPRLRAIEDEKFKNKIFEPPPPTVSRISGLAQGCGGALMTLAALLMLWAALGSGFYLWGPGLLLVGGGVLAFSTGGVWNGRRTPVVVAIITLTAIALLAYYWLPFIQAAAFLVPLQGLNIILQLGQALVGLVLLVAFFANAVSLLYWKRLKPVNRRGAMIWGSVSVALIALMIALNFFDLQQRKSWLEEQFATWSAAAKADSLAFGSNANVTLGSAFLTMEEGDDSNLDVRLAELNAAVDADVSLIRLSASGDMLLEEDEPRIFKVDEDAEDPEAEAQKNAARIERQQAAENEYMTTLLDSGTGLVIADAQTSFYMVVWGSQEDDKDEEPFTWETFTDLQEWRVRRYAAQYQPAAYEIINSPETYAQFNGFHEPEEDGRLDAWAAQTERLIAAVAEESPDTRIGVTLSSGSDFELEYYDRLLELDGLDFIGFRLFARTTFDELETILKEHGHPADFGKELWIIETWNGYCLAPQRSMELDALWLETVAAFAAKENITTVLATDYGCFAQAGGSLFQDAGAPDERTEVWKRWRDLVAQWQVKE
jgi:hypothetical protein